MNRTIASYTQPNLQLCRDINLTMVGLISGLDIERDLLIKKPHDAVCSLNGHIQKHEHM